MMVKIVIHNGATVGRVIPHVNSMTITRAYDNRIIWADGDICAPFFVLPAGIEVSPGMSVESIREHDITDSLNNADSLYQELLERIQRLEQEKEAQ